VKKTLTLPGVAIAFGLIAILSTCKKGGTGPANNVNTSLHADNMTPGSPVNRTLFFAPSAINAQQFLSVSSTSAGPGDPGVTGFNLMTIDKATGLKSMYYYITDSTANYEVQMATCAATDNSGNVWVAGYSATAKEDYDKPYVVKIDSKGNILLAKSFSKKESQYVYKNYLADGIKVLNNGDVLLLIVSGGDLQLIRMQSDGTVIWDKQFAVTGATVFGLAQGHNSFITENAQGDIFFLSSQYYVANAGTYLTRITSAGNLVYTIGYHNIGFDYYMQLESLSTGDLLLFGQNDLSGQSTIPYIVKINPVDGSILAAMQEPTALAGPNFMTINDIVEAKGQLKISFTAARQFSITTMDYNLNMLGSVILLEKPSGNFAATSLLYDSGTNALFHLADEKSPAPGSFMQFLRTDINGKSCHIYSDNPLQLQMINFDPGVVNSAMLITNDIPGDAPATFIPSKLSTSVADGCIE
jgi:hypothetical protein